MKNIIQFSVAAVLAVTISYTANADPITGNIGFDGTALLNTGNVTTATAVTLWGTNTVGSESGTFANYNGGIPLGTALDLTGADGWAFNSGGVTNFWQVGGFTFNLSSSTSTTVSLGGVDFLFVDLTGTVSGNGFSSTPFEGSFSTQNPPSDGNVTFTESLSFNPVAVPEPGTTVLLLVASLPVLAAMKRKLLA